MSTKNTVADLDAKNKGRFTGPFLTYVNSLVILFICNPLLCCSARPELRVREPTTQDGLLHLWLRCQRPMSVDSADHAQPGTDLEYSLWALALHPWIQHTWPSRSTLGAGAAHRKPMLLLLFVGLLLLRFATRKLLSLLFQPPPRSTLLSIRPYCPVQWAAVSHQRLGVDH